MTIGAEPVIIHRQSSVVTCRAFTLIELLMVTSILVMLTALLLPVVHKARKQAQAVACMAQLRQGGVLLCTHADEHEGKLVNATEAQSLFRNAYGHGSGEALSCPAAPRLPATSDPGGPSPGAGAEYFVTTASYGYNAHLEYERYSRLTRPARMPLVFDAAREAVAPCHFSAPPAYEGDCWGGRGVDRPEMKAVCINRHQGAVNALFLDWTGPQGGSEGTLDAQVVRVIRYRRALDQGRGHPAQGLACLDAQVQGLLTRRTACSQRKGPEACVRAIAMGLWCAAMDTLLPTR